MKKIYISSSFHFTQRTIKEVSYLAQKYGENKSAVVRRLITQAYNLEKCSDSHYRESNEKKYHEKNMELPF